MNISAVKVESRNEVEIIGEKSELKYLYMFFFNWFLKLNKPFRKKKHSNNFNLWPSHWLIDAACKSPNGLQCLSGAGAAVQEEVADCGRLLLRRTRSWRNQTHGGQSRAVARCSSQGFKRTYHKVTSAPSRLTRGALWSCTGGAYLSVYWSIYPVCLWEQRKWKSVVWSVQHVVFWIPTFTNTQ